MESADEDDRADDGSNMMRRTSKDFKMAEEWEG